jgi:hypothetical protein
MLLGMALAGLMTAVIMHSRAAATPAFWWLAGLAYAASVVMVVTGIYAINMEPQARRRTPLPPPGPPPRGPSATRVFTSPRLVGPVLAKSEVELAELRQRIGDLLVEEWGLVSRQQLDRARAEQERTGQSLVEVLGRLGLLSDEDLERILELRSAALDPWHDTPRHE